uniref:non-specific serine/threonine protein kinase n=1 Tax=Ascaris suum TaxID=6253 RepID=F1L3Y1_ASCSU
MLDGRVIDKKLLHLEEPSSSSWVKDNFIVGDVLGSGTFGTVYAVECRRNPGRFYAMKELTRNSLPKYVATELRILQRCGGVRNIVRMHAAHRDKDRVFIVMDYFEHTSMREILASITTKEIMEYMKNLLSALQYLHSKGIIHRDIKPSNFLFDRKRKRFCLIDFGLCEELNRCRSSVKNSQLRSVNGKQRCAAKRICLDSGNDLGGGDSENDESRMTESRKGPEGYRSDSTMKCNCFAQPRVCSICQRRPLHHVNKAGTPGFRAPEVLLKSTEQTPLMDIWAAGITFLSLLCGRHPIMRPADDHEAIAQLSTVFGTLPLQQLASKINASLLFYPAFPGLDIVKFVRAVRFGIESTPNDHSCLICSNLFFENASGVCLCKVSEQSSLRGLAPDERQVFEVLKKCLVVDPAERYSAEMLSALLC